MADDPEENSRQAIVETAQLGARILRDSEEFYRKVKEVAKLGITGFDITFVVRGLEPGIKGLKNPGPPVKLSGPALTSRDIEFAKNNKIRMDETEIEDIKKAFSEILKEGGPHAPEDVKEIPDDEFEESEEKLNGGKRLEVQEGQQEERSTNRVLASIGLKLHNFTTIHRILFIFGLSGLNIFKHLNLGRYLGKAGIASLFNDEDWLGALEIIFRSICTQKDPEIKKELLSCLDNYISCVMKTVQYFESLQD
jgi:hypothetical protein